MPQRPLDLYRSRKHDFEQLAQKLDRQGLRLANTRLVLFLAAAALAVLVWIHRLPNEVLWPALAAFASFIAVALWHDRVIGREQRAKIRAQINDNGLARLEDRWDSLPAKGERFLDPEHPYARDLDIFGAHSLFQLVDATTIRPGEDVLGRWLSAPSPLAEVAARQEAVRELAPLFELRETLECEGRLLAREKPDVAALIAWAEGPSPLPAWAANPWLPRALPLLTLALFLAGREKWIPSWLWLAVVAVQAALIGLTVRGVGRLSNAISARGEKLLRFEKLLEVAERTQFTSPKLAQLSQALRSSGAPPSVEMARLVRDAGFLQLRMQPLFHFPVNVLGLWDLHFAGSLVRWQSRAGKRLRLWMEALGELEALSSLARFCFDNPAASWPVLKEEGPRLCGQGLGHPLIPEARRVVNDVELGDSVRALLITGSNMSGKTTLLRTLGVNAVLALAGGPVCAQKLELSLLDVRTSMRIQDSLAQGLSFFYAELRRLKMVVDGCQQSPSLFLLDEVLQGTNTAERHAASRAILRRLVDRGAIGGIATHDLGLCTLEEQTGGRVSNVHFTDQIKDGEMLFDYRLRRGVVSTTNALALLKKVGIDVEVSVG